MSNIHSTNQKVARLLRLATFIKYELRTLIAILGCVPGSALEESVIGFNIRSQVNNFTGCQLSCGIKHNRFAVMIGGLVMTGKADIADVFAAFGGVSGRDLVFGENRRKRALRHTGAAINAGVGIDIHPRPFSYRLAGDNTLDGTDFDATAVTNA